MSQDCVVGLDAGTSVTKAVAFGLGGEELASAAKPNSFERLPGGKVEQGMARTWDDAAEVLRDLAAKMAEAGLKPVALGVTGQGDGTWFVDAQGQPAGPGLLWLDARAAAIVEEAEASGARARAFGFTGCGLNACNQSSHWMWFKRHEPEQLERAAYGMHCKDWLHLKLTGVVATDPTEGVFTFGDFRTGAYEDAVLEAFGLAEFKRLLPPILDGTEAVHPLTAEGAAATDLPEGLPVSLGYVDVVCTALGAGLFDPQGNAAASIVGSTGMHMVLRKVEDVELPNEPSGYVMRFPAPGYVSQMQTNMAATLNIDWVADLARQAAVALGLPDVPRGEAIRLLDKAAADATPGAALFHPYIDRAGERGPFVDGFARASWNGLSTAVSFPDLARGVYEGLAFAAGDCYGAMNARPSEVRMAGGGARSALLRRIFAGCLGTPVREVNRGEAGAAGAAMIALKGAGMAPGMAELAEAWVRPTLGSTVESDPELRRLYADLAPVYTDLRSAMPDRWRALARARGEAS